MGVAIYHIFTVGTFGVLIVEFGGGLGGCAVCIITIKISTFGILIVVLIDLLCGWAVAQ